MNGPFESEGHREDSARLGLAAAVFLAVGMEPNDLVMGVSINGDSRAYPVRYLRWREMVNDEVGGIPILVTW